MAVVLVIKTNDGQTMFHGRHDQNYGADRSAHQVLAQSLVTRHHPTKTLSAWGLGDSDTMDAWLDAGGDMHNVEVDGDGNITLPTIP